uniref:PAS domain-containing protein n=1 Tax=Mantoniella antarctica TaxID=81844 RepID=A0A7S0SRQ4_9CHLO
MESVGRGEALKVSVTHVEMKLKGEGGTLLSGFFDWSVGLVSAALSNILDKSAHYEGGRGLILMGEPCSEQTVRQRAKDSETADFIQNAPIPLQSTDCKGVIQWANLAMLDMMEYTQDEYVGRHCSDFAPDDQKDLMSEMAKAVHCGKKIKEVPVCFYRKNGGIVPLLLDTNVSYSEDGRFHHTRCFFRDDTGRRVREARAEALVDEMDRSLSLLDNFMSNALHFVRTPCNVMTQALDAARGQLDSTNLKAILHVNHSNPVISEAAKAAILESKLMLDVTVGQLSDLTRTLDDVSDLQRFEQGAELRPVINDVELLPLCHSVMAECALRCHEGVECVLDIGGATHASKLKSTR